MADYLIPAKPVRTEQHVKRSRFVCHIEHCPDRQSAEMFIGKIALQHHDASHNCWAMIAGSPDDPQGYGMNDDGEPRGCAGKPMFTVLQHSGIGEIAVVVSRWFGGIKLGTGGMARAYSSSVQHGLAALAVTEKIHYTPVTLALPYDLLQTVNHTIDRLNGRIANQAYRELVLVDVDVPCRREEEFKKELEEKGQGRISYRRR